MEAAKLEIVLKPSVKPIVRFGIAFQGIFILLSTIPVFFIGYNLFKGLTLSLVAGAIASLLYFFVARNYLKNVFYKEKMIVNGKRIIVSYNGWATSKEREFELDEIEHLRYAGNVQYTQHPMHNPVVDFTGLAVGEKQLQFLIDDGTMEIVTKDETFRFGKNMTSWDAEEVIEKIEYFTGREFNKTSDHTTHTNP